MQTIKRVLSRSPTSRGYTAVLLALFFLLPVLAVFSTGPGSPLFDPRHVSGDYPAILVWLADAVPTALMSLWFVVLILLAVRFVSASMQSSAKPAGSPLARIVAIVLALAVTGIIFLFSSWHLLGPIGTLQCLCGGCCLGCPGDCDLNRGFPIIYYASGYNISGGNVRLISYSGLLIDGALWAILVSLIHRFIYRRGAKKA